MGSAHPTAALFRRLRTNTAGRETGRSWRQSGKLHLAKRALQPAKWLCAGQTRISLKSIM